MKYFVLLLALAAAAARAEEIPQGSLFLTQDETHEAEGLAAGEMPGKGAITLGAVLYYGPGDWSLWLQGAKWGPQTSRDGLRVIGVSAEEVHLAWRDDDGKEREIALKPNESYQILTGKIVKGP